MIRVEVLCDRTDTLDKSRVILGRFGAFANGRFQITKRLLAHNVRPFVDSLIANNELWNRNVDGPLSGSGKHVFA